MVQLQGDEEAVSVLSVYSLGQHPKGSRGKTHKGHIVTTRKGDAAGPSAEINRSKIRAL